MQTPLPPNVSPLTSLAQDVSRVVLGGARQDIAPDTSRPEAILTGRQISRADVADLDVDVKFVADSGSTATISGHRTDLSKVEEKVRTSLTTDAPRYYHLAEDPDVPVWVYRRRTFGVPDKPAPEDVFEAAGRRTWRLSPAALHEAASHTPSDDGGPVVTLCTVTPSAERPEQLVVTPLPPVRPPSPDVVWSAAQLFRCPIKPAWDATAAVKVPVFELGGIPQGDRYYLDQLGLLDKPGDSAVVGGVRLYLEYRSTSETNPPPVEFKSWVLARKNLTEQARPGPALAMGLNAKATPYPYTATQAAPANTLRLLQMTSIANSGGYFLRPYDVALPPADATNLTLVVVVDFKQTAAEGTAADASDATDALALPSAANAVTFAAPTPGAVPPTLLRFEQQQHCDVEPYAAPGCVAVGFVRHLPWSQPSSQTTQVPQDDPNHITEIQGFAESVHLVEFEVCDSTSTSTTNDRIVEWREVSPDEAERAGDQKVGSVTWRPRRSRSDVRPPLFPRQPESPDDPPPAAAALVPTAAATPRRARKVAVALDRRRTAAPSPAARAMATPANEHSYHYRAVVRYAIDDLFARLKDEPHTFTIKARLRDLQGNRFLPNGGSPTGTADGSLTFLRGLYYTDRVIPPAEWPGTRFTAIALPEKPGEFRLRIAYKRPNDVADPGAHKQMERKLRLIRDQLRGAGDDDVTVALVNGVPVPAASKDSADPDTATIKITPAAGLDLRKGLIDFLGEVLNDNGGQEIEKKFSFFVRPVGAATRPVRFEPVLAVTRSSHLPPQSVSDALPEALRAVVTVQVGGAASPAKFALDGDADAGAEMNKLAATFRLDGHVTGLARNRFNEHELWFVPDQLFPAAASAADSTTVTAPAFHTARPLSNQVETATFLVPDFTTWSAGTGWKGFAFEPAARTFTRTDYDVVALTVFESLETMLRPDVLTERAPGGTPAALWNEVLAAKDELGQALAKESVVVPMFAGAAADESAAGAARVAADTFRRDLRNFYRVGTFVGLPLVPPPTVPGQTSGITTFYGRVEPGDLASPAGSTPAVFSDAVLDVADDLAGQSVGHLTVSYALPPGGEKHWRDWKTGTLGVTFTHLQLERPGEVRTPFDRGQWIELLATAPAGPSGHSPAELEWTLDGKIPVIDRSFPPEPQLRSVEATAPPFARSSPIVLGADDAATLTRWGWAIDFAATLDADDRVLLEVEYFDDDPPPAAVSAKTFGVDETPFVGLLQALLVADRLTKSPAAWADAARPDAVAGLADLLRLMALSLVGRPAFAMAAGRDRRVDHFAFDPSTPSKPPLFDNPLVRSVSFTRPGAGTFRVTADPVDADNRLRLFGQSSDQSFNARTFRPILMQKRNDTLLTDRTTTASLVYTCGPVSWPNEVRVRNEWALVQVTPKAGATPPRTLVESLTAALRVMLGSTDLKTLAVRADVKHAFRLTPVDEPQTNPVLLFPVDYPMTSADALAGEIAGGYTAWLARSGAPAEQRLRKMIRPALRVGLQLALLKKGDSDATQNQPGRVLLHVDALEFDA